jgi:peptide/nickel transport system permease protein
MLNVTIIKKGEPKSMSSFQLAMHRFAHNKSALFGMTVVAILVILAILAPWISKYPYDQIDIANSFSTPSWDHPFGTDDLGRDILSRMMFGGRYSLSIGILAVVISAVFGIFLGSVAGYFGGQTDNIIMRFIDILQSFPQILLAIVISAALGTGYDKAIIALGISGIPVFTRMMRANILNIRSMEYVEAATSINCSSARIILKHVIPNAFSPLIVQLSLSLAYSVLAAASLSFIGLGVQPPLPEWGAMLSAGRNFIMDYPHLVMFPGVYIMICVLAFNIIGDAMRDVLDPKLKK